MHYIWRNVYSEWYISPNITHRYEKSVDWTLRIARNSNNFCQKQNEHSLGLIDKALTMEVLFGEK